MVENNPSEICENCGRELLEHFSGNYCVRQDNLNGDNNQQIDVKKDASSHSDEHLGANETSQGKKITSEMPDDADNQHPADNIEQQLRDIAKAIRKSKNYWRFNYSVGFSNGSCYGGNYDSCYGGSYEDKNKLKDELENG